MTTYAEYQTQIAELQKLAEIARRNEITAAKDQIAKIMRENGLTAADLDGKAGKAAKPVKEPLPAVYRDPVSGDTWGGLGRCPAWISGKDRTQFLIKTDAEQA